MPPRERHLPMSRRACASRTGPRSRSRVHIRPQPGYGYDERRHVSVWGRVQLQEGSLIVAAAAAWSWDESEVPFFEYSEQSIGQSRRRFDALSAERGTPVRPQLSRGWLALHYDSAAVPDRHPRPDPDRIDDRGPARLLRSAHRAADAGRWLAHSDRAQRRKRCLRHRAGRRRDERHADALLGWITASSSTGS